MTVAPAPGVCGPRWRALLEDRWQARVREITELSLAYHTAAAARGGPATGPPRGRRKRCSAVRSRPAGGWPTSRTPSSGWRRAASGRASSADPRSRSRGSPLRPRPGTARAAPRSRIVGGAVAASWWRDRSRGRRTGAHVTALASLQVDSVDLLRHRDRHPRPRRGPAGAAQRDRHHRPRRGDRGQRRSPHRAARGLRRGRRVPRRQPFLPARPPLRAARRAPVLSRREGHGPARLGRALARAVRDAAHRRLPVHPRRADGGHAVLRHRRL